MTVQLVRFEPRPFEELCRTFSWPRPATYNIGADVCDKWAHAQDRLALIDIAAEGEPTRYSFADLARRSNRWAHALAGLGIGRGDRVAVILSQRPETALAHIAAYKLGAIAVPLAVLFGDEALEYRLRDSGARAVVFDEQAAAKLDRIKGRLPELRQFIAVDRAGLEISGARASSALEEGVSDQFVSADTRPEDPPSSSTLPGRRARRRERSCLTPR